MRVFVMPNTITHLTFAVGLLVSHECTNTYLNIYSRRPDAMMSRSVVSLGLINIAMEGLLFLSLFGQVVSTTFSIPEPKQTEHPDMLRCPQNCSCSVTGDGGVNVTCRDGTPSDIINNLPENTVHFRYTYDSLFNDSGCQFRLMPTLQTITITTTDLFSYATPHSHLQNADLFGGVSNLRELHINLLLSKLDSKVLEPLAKLEILDLSHSRSLTRENMEDILNGTVRFHPKLRKLHIQNLYYRIPVKGEILDASANIFSHLNGSQIEELDIFLNGVIFSTPGLSQYLPNLKILLNTNLMGRSKTYGPLCTLADTLLHPSLERVKHGRQSFDDYRGARSKRSLLKRNHLDELLNCINDINISAPCSPDLTCDIGRCLCNGHDSIPTQYIPELTQWFSIFTGITIPMPRLKYADLSRAMDLWTSRILTIPFNKNNSLEHLDLSDNQMFWLPHVTGLERLRYLNIPNNNVDVAQQKLENYPNLRELYVGGNRITFSNDRQLFKNNSHLEKISLRRCGIRTIPQHEIVYLKKLKVLELDMNQMSDFVLNMRKLLDLRLLNLSGNYISSLLENVTTTLSELVKTQDVTLDLTGNPLSCGCNDFHFIEWLKTTNVILSQHQALTCNHPTLGSVPIMTVRIADLHHICVPSYASIIAGSISGTLAFVLIIMGIIVIRRNKWTIRYYVHAARQSFRRRFGNGYDLLDDNYMYDAFVVYSAQDRFWVHDDLMKRLENQQGMHLCIHYRDFIPGHDIEDTIIEALKSSRKAISVLSPSFLQSNWCHFEFRMARQIDIEENRDMVILVILESISGLSISRTLTSMLQKRTYLCWTNDTEGQTLFWAQLVNALKGR